MKLIKLTQDYTLTTQKDEDAHTRLMYFDMMRL